MAIERKVALERLVKFQLQVDKHLRKIVKHPDHSMSVRKLPLNGDRSLKATGGSSTTRRKDRQLNELLQRIFNRFQKLTDPASHRKAREDFIFHMTDWKADLRKLAELYAHPERFDAHSASSAVAGFLIHALAHVRAARLLMLDDEGAYFVESAQSILDSASAKR